MALHISWSSHTSDSEIDTQMAILPDTLHCGVSARIGWLGVSNL